jgi:hypothetical protein
MQVLKMPCNPTNQAASSVDNSTDSLSAVRRFFRAFCEIFLLMSGPLFFLAGFLCAVHMSGWILREVQTMPSIEVAPSSIQKETP